jgi:hypothetical protein
MENPKDEQDRIAFLIVAAFFVVVLAIFTAIAIWFIRWILGL